MKKRFMIAAAMCVGGLLSAKEASAGHWEEVPNNEIGYTAPWYAENELRLDGTAGYSVPSSWGYTPNQETKPWKEKGKEEVGFGWSNVLNKGGYGGSASVMSIGTIKTKFKWVRDLVGGAPDPADNPPDVLKVKVEAQAGLFVFNSALEDHNATIELKIEDEEAVNTSPTIYISQSNVDKSFLLHVTTYGQDEVWIPPIRFHGSANFHAGTNTGANIRSEGNYQYNVEFDNRTLKITSDLEPSYYKPAVYVDPLVPFAHARNADDSMVIDTVAVIREVDTLVGTISIPVYEWSGLVSLTADQTGYVTPEAEWDDSGPGEGVRGEPRLRLSNLDGPYAPGNMEALFFAKFGADTTTSSVNFPITNSFKVKVTDQDGAIGYNTYEINWHRPFEGYVNLNTGGLPVDETKYYYGDVTVCDVPSETNINLDGSPVIFDVHKTLLGKLSDYVVGGFAILEVPATLLAPEWQLVLAALKQLPAIDFGDEQRSVTQNTSGMFANAKILGLVPSGAVFEEYHLTKPFFYAKYHVNNKRGDVYSVNGFTGQDDRVVAELFADGAAGEYQKIGGSM